jgi:outer membrane protein TolC
MRLNYPMLLVLMSALGFSGCATRHVDAVRPEARSLASDFETFKVPEEPSSALAPADPEEPTGVIDMRSALAQALMKSPELAAFSWEIRAREAATAQAGLFPNPEVGVEMENFGGSGEFEDFE